VKTVLGIETSCDETAVAIMRGGKETGSVLLASEVASQIAAHEKFGGIVPEVASRNHLVYAPRLLDRALNPATIGLSELDAFAATSGPGLASSLMIGASIAKGLAIGLGKPYLAINHLEGHLLSPFFGTGTQPDEIRANVALIVSGGHTMLVRVRALGEYKLIGRTVDDAAGEAFDKVARLLGLRYPGGPDIEEHARGGDPTHFDLPRSMPESENFSFSGLKTAVRYLLRDISGDGGGAASKDASSTRAPVKFDNNDHVLADVCASFQQAVIDVLVCKTIAAARRYQSNLVTVSGGVSCNQALRKQLAEACTRDGLEFKAAAPWLCTDNAAMIAFAALLRLLAGFESHVTEEIDPNLPLAC
jgi:N6-L-threonylcarbamoyladenine synthase